MTRGPGRPRDADGDRTRLQIVEALTRRPGLNRTQLAEQLGYQVATIRFHLAQLATRGAIHVLKKGRAWTYYRRDIPTELQLPLASLAQRGAGRVLQIIRSNPGLNEARIAERAAWSRKVIRRLVADLEAAGLIQRRLGHGLIASPAARSVDHFMAQQSSQGIDAIQRLIANPPTHAAHKPGNP